MYYVNGFTLLFDTHASIEDLLIGAVCAIAGILFVCRIRERIRTATDTGFDVIAFSALSWSCQVEHEKWCDWRKANTLTIVMFVCVGDHPIRRKQHT